MTVFVKVNVCVTHTHTYTHTHTHTDTNTHTHTHTHIKAGSQQNVGWGNLFPRATLYDSLTLNVRAPQAQLG